MLTTRHAPRLPLPAVGLLALLLPALAPAPARANSVELRATTIPATACTVESTTLGGGSAVLTNGVWTANAPSAGGIAAIVLDCPLGVSPVPLSGTGAVRMTSYRLHYRDSDSHSTAASVHAEIIANNITTFNAGGATGGHVFCSFFSNDTSSPTSSAATYFNKSCAFTLSQATFYIIQVFLYVAGAGQQAAFLGIDFP